jgi:hypothetical protein
MYTVLRWVAGLGMYSWSLPLNLQSISSSKAPVGSILRVLCDLPIEYVPTGYRFWVSIAQPEVGLHKLARN